MPKSGFTVQIIMLVALIALMYFLLIRPQKKREKSVNEMRNSIKTGDEVITIGGIYGKVVKVRDDRLTIQVGSDKTKMEITRWAVSKIETPSAQKSGKPEREVEEEKSRKPKPKKMLKKAEEEPAQETESTVEEPAPSVDLEKSSEVDLEKSSEAVETAEPVKE